MILYKIKVYKVKLDHIENGLFWQHCKSFYFDLILLINQFL